MLFDLLIMAETLARVGVPEPIKRPDERFIVAMRARRRKPQAAGLGEAHGVPSGVVGG